jgi:ribosome-associated translation inhibitor RaiA
MMRIRIDEALRDQWLPVIAHHFQMTLATCMPQLRALAVHFGTEIDQPNRANSYVCELRGRHHDGRELRIRSTHSDPETAIGHAFARTRREVRRQRLRGGAALA